jgi:hypothetical protein
MDILRVKYYCLLGFRNTPSICLHLNNKLYEQQIPKFSNCYEVATNLIQSLKQRIVFSDPEFRIFKLNNHKGGE